MPHANFFEFLADSIDLLKKESSENYLQLASALAGLQASISTGLEKRLVYFDGNQFVVTTDLSNPDIDVVFRNDVIIDLIDGRYSLEKAVLDDAVFVKGTVVMLEKFYSALSIYLQGALRSRSFPFLLANYRRAVSTEDSQ
jgi:hypothetical protein